LKAKENPEIALVFHNTTFAPLPILETEISAG
jgi:hypothetical protein